MLDPKRPVSGVFPFFDDPAGEEFGFPRLPPPPKARPFRRNLAKRLWKGISNRDGKVVILFRFAVAYNWRCGPLAQLVRAGDL